MSTRFNVVLPDELNAEIDKVVEQSEISKSEFLRKAIQLYIAANKGKQSGLSVGLADPKTRMMQTEFIGL